MSNVYTLKLDSKQENKLFETFKENKTKAPQYAKWQLKCENCVITCYQSGKTVFQGKDADTYASAFINIPKQESISKDTLPQAGSDEVGTGDYFGPVVVCASIVDEYTDSLLKDLGVRDSKQLNDNDILEIAPKIIQRVPHSLLIVDNEKYNEVHKTNNLNAIKAKLHNQAYVHLAKKYGLPKLMIIDQFTPENNYYKYLSGQPDIIRNIHFETKAEDKYLSVAISSMIARNAFLDTLDKMNEAYGMTFQKGGGSQADECAREFIQKYGFDRLGEVAKLHFKNTERL